MNSVGPNNTVPPLIPALVHLFPMVTALLCTRGPKQVVTGRCPCIFSPRAAVKTCRVQPLLRHPLWGQRASPTTLPSITVQVQRGWTELGRRFCTWVGSMGVGPNLILLKRLWWVVSRSPHEDQVFGFICNVFRALFFAVRAVNHSVKINTRLRFSKKEKKI